MTLGTSLSSAVATCPTGYKPMGYTAVRMRNHSMVGAMFTRADHSPARMCLCWSMGALNRPPQQTAALAVTAAAWQTAVGAVAALVVAVPTGVPTVVV